MASKSVAVPRAAGTLDGRIEGGVGGIETDRGPFVWVLGATATGSTPANPFFCDLLS